MQSEDQVGHCSDSSTQSSVGALGLGGSCRWLALAVMSRLQLQQLPQQLHALNTAAPGLLLFYATRPLCSILLHLHDTLRLFDPLFAWP